MWLWTTVYELDVDDGVIVTSRERSAALDAETSAGA